MSELTFHSPTDEPIRVASTSGHIAMVGPDPRPLPEPYHQNAIIAGCVTNAGKVRAAAHTPKAGPNAQTNEDSAALIRKALTALIEKNDAADFTADNLPKVASVTREAGFTVKKEDVQAVWQEMRDAAQAQKDAEEAAAAAAAGNKTPIE